MNRSFVAMTFNIGNGLAPVGRLCRYLLSVEADVIALQEVSAAQARAIETALGDCFPHQVMRGAGHAGKAILSRYPIVAHEWIETDPDRPDLQATILVDGEALTVVNAHPPPPRPTSAGLIFDPVARQQIFDAAGIAIATAPAVLLGDFNMTVRNPAYRWMTSIGLRDAWQEAGAAPGRTLPLRLNRTRRVQRSLAWVPLRPMARVDFILHTEGIAAHEAWVGEDAGSDHLPVLARLSAEPRNVLPRLRSREFTLG